jgi:hypothetical protein
MQLLVQRKMNVCVCVMKQLLILRELSGYRLHLVGVQEVRWEGSGTVPAGEYTFCMERGMRTMNWVQGFCT